MVTPAWVATRALLETLFTLGAVVEDDEVLQKYLKEDDVQRRKLLRKLKNVANPYFSRMADPTLEAELDTQIKESGAHQLSTEYLADKAGLRDWYLIAYALMTGPAHTKVRDLQKYFTVGASSIDFAFPRRDIDLRAILSTAAIVFLLAFARVDQAFDRRGHDRNAEIAYFFELEDVNDDGDAGDGDERE
jgi:hypothetical protein